jgi:hypothetical protein
MKQGRFIPFSVIIRFPMTHNSHKNPQGQETRSSKLTDKKKIRLSESQLTQVLKAFGGLSEMLD